MEKRHPLASYPDYGCGCGKRTPCKPATPQASQAPPAWQSKHLAWLDEQERLIRMRGIPNEVVREFDPLHNLPEPQGDDVERGRRTIEFRFTENLEGSIADRIQAKIVEHVKSRFMLKLSAQVELRHVEEANRKMDYFQRDNGSSPWFETLAAAENWLRQQEELRLENMRPPDTKPTRGPSGCMSKSSWIAILCSLGKGVYLIGFAARPEFCLWTPIGTIVASSAASLFIGVRRSETTCAKPESLRNPSSLNGPAFVTA